MKHLHIIAPIIVALQLLALTAVAADPEGPPAISSHDAPARAEMPVLTLEACVAKAIANSTKLSAERHRLAAMEAQRKQLQWFPFSMIEFKGMFTMVPDKCADMTGGLLTSCDSDGGIPSDYDFKNRSWGPSFHIGLDVTLPIPVSKKMHAANKAVRAGIAAKDAMFPKMTDEIRYNVHRAWHAVIGAREMLYTLSEGSRHLANARTRLEENLEKQEGTETEVDLIKLKVFEAQLAAMVTQAEQIERTALSALAFLIGAPSSDALNLPEDPQEMLGFELQSLQDYQQQALENRPEFEALRHVVKAMNAKLEMARAGFAPDVALVVNWRGAHTPGVTVREQKQSSDGTAYYDDASIPFVYRDSYNYGSWLPGIALVMRYPLDIGMDVHRVKEARAQLAATMLDQQQAIEGILLEVEATYIEITSIAAGIDALHQARRLAKGWMAAAVQNYATGIGSSKDVKDALKEYFVIMAQLHQKISEYNIGLASLERVTGSPTLPIVN